jgi:hypothetical protein
MLDLIEPAYGVANLALIRTFLKISFKLGLFNPDVGGKRLRRERGRQRSRASSAVLLDQEVRAHYSDVG